MIEPYTAVGLIPTVRGIRKRADIDRNLEHISHLIKAASWLSSLDLPVRLIAIPEGALQAFNDEVLDLDHVTFAGECAIDIPGPETRFLGELAKDWNAYIMAQAKARARDFPDRFFNVGFAIDPQRRDHPQALQALHAVPGRALGDPARRLGPVDRAVRRAPSTRSSRWPTPRSAGSA